MANRRLADLIEQFHITIETTEVRPTGSFFPRGYTLVHDGRTLKGKMHADGTITCIEALYAQFVIAHAKLPGQKKAKKALITFLGNEYDACLQAFQADEAEAMRGQFLDVRPDPPGRENREREIPFTSLFTDDLTFGMRVVSFNQIVVPTVSVGRIEEVRPTSLWEMAETGRVADVVLLQADRHEHLADRFSQQFLYRSHDPLAPGIYPWPKSLPEQTFTWPKRPGNLVTFPLMTTPFKIHILTSFDFLEEQSEKDRDAQKSEDIEGK